MILLLRGALLLQSALPTTTTHSCADEPGNMFGFALASVGDVDGDRVQDFIVGDPIPDDEDSPRPGRAWLVSTRTGKALLELSAGEPGDRFGQVVAGPGDIDCDCVPDVLVGATPREGGPSVIRAYSGAKGTLLDTIEIDELEDRDFEGWSCLAGVGDLDGDGCADYAIATAAGDHPDPVPRFYLRSGRGGSLLFTLRPGMEIRSPYRSIACAGDLDQDGILDLVASRESGEPVIEIWSLGKRERIHGIRLDREAWRLPVTGGSDLDGDGRVDIVVGVASTSEEPARVVAFSGKDGTTIREWKARPSLFFAEFVDFVGDLDSDGTSDLLVRAPDSSSQVSRVWVLSGKEDRVIHAWEDGPWMGSFFGVSGTGIGDVNGDGVPDVLIGEASKKAGGAFPGHVRLYSGKTGREIRRWGQQDIRRRR